MRWEVKKSVGGWDGQRSKVTGWELLVFLLSFPTQPSQHIPCNVTMCWGGKLLVQKIISGWFTHEPFHWKCWNIAGKGCMCEWNSSVFECGVGGHKFVCRGLAGILYFIFVTGWEGNSCVGMWEKQENTWTRELNLLLGGMNTHVYKCSCTGIFLWGVLDH